MIGSDSKIDVGVAATAIRAGGAERLSAGSAARFVCTQSTGTTPLPDSAPRYHGVMTQPRRRTTRKTRGTVATVCLLLLAACTPASKDVELRGETMGTTWSVKVARHNVDAEALQAGLAALLVHVNALMSTWQPDSELMRLNAAPAGTAFAVSPETARVLRLAREISEASGGQYDVTVGPLVNLWGFGPDQQPVRVPSEMEIEAARNRVGYKRFTLREQEVTKLADIFIDLSSIAKGYAVDALAAELERQGITDFLIEVGGELGARGRNGSGVPWRVAVEIPDPAGRAPYRVLSLRDMGIATSGDYRNYFEVDGRRFSHTINPLTGAPVTHKVASVTVLHQSVAMADGWATAFNVMGLEHGRRLAEALDLKVLFLVRTDDAFEPFATPAFDAYVNNLEHESVVH